MSLNNPDYMDYILNKGKRGPKYKFESLKEGSAVYRILPSFNDQNRRIEAVYYVHWLTGENGKPTKVSCTYGSERYCPICEKHRETKDALNSARATDPSSQNTKRLQEAEDKLRASKTIFYNAVNAANEAVVLQLSSTVSALLEKKIIEAVQQKGFDPLSLSGGVWFRFNKQGKGRDSVTVDFNRVSVKDAEGEIAEKLDKHALPEELVSRLQNEVANIHDAKSMYVNQYTANELADYLRGKALPNKRATGSQAATTQSNQRAEASAEDDVPFETTGTSTANTSAKADTSAVAGGSGVKTAADYAAEAERFRKLLNQNR